MITDTAYIIGISAKERDSPSEMEKGENSNHNYITTMAWEM